MKKVIEGELLSIAHRILKMKEKDVDSLLKESKELYEKLLILKFYQTNFDLGLIQDITPDALESKLQSYHAIEEVAVSRPQMPLDLVEEDYPIVIDQEETYSAPVIVNDIPLEEKETSLVEKEIEVLEQDSIVEEEILSPMESVISDEVAKEIEVLEQDSTAEEEILSPMESVISDEVEKIKEEVAEYSEDSSIAEVTYAFEAHQVAVSETEVAPIKEEVQAFLDELANVSAAEKVEEEEEEEVVQFLGTPSPLAAEEEKAYFDSLEDEEESVSYVEDEPKTTAGSEHISFFGLEKKEDNPFSGFDFTDVNFERVSAEETVEEQNKQTTEVDVNTLFNLESTQVTEPRVTRTKSLNDIYNATIVVGLNDRIAFEKHLFNGSAEDFNRVLSQLNTVSSYDEAVSLIEHLVKPEYDSWRGKEEYEERFMTLVEKRFN